MLSSATFDTERMKEEAGKGFSTATELADTLVRDYGLPFRTAHNIVGRSVQKGSLTLETLEESAKELDLGISLAGKGLTQDQIEKALDVANSVGLRKATGGRRRLRPRSRLPTARSSSTRTPRSSIHGLQKYQRQRKTCFPMHGGW